MTILGLLLITLGGFAAGSFYIPFKKVRNWAWETYWLVNGLFSWIIMPWLIAFITVPALCLVLREAPASSIFWTFLFGLLWGIGGLTFGLSICAAFGTIVPPIYKGTFGELITSISGLTTLAGVLVCLVGIAICGWAGISKEKELSAEEKKKAIKEFNFVKGLLVAIFAGIMSACMAFGFTAGEPIAKLAIENKAPPLWQNNPVLIVIFAGGFTTNFIWCVFLNIKNRSAKNYIDTRAPLINNYIFSALAGITWYLQFMFYGMGKTKMGKYSFASWTVLMALIIVFSNIWGLIFREWKGTSRRTHLIILAGILVLIASTLVVGLGNYLESIGK
jgi:L-rhamnose-H+ transport protein